MKKYINPEYERESITTKDVITMSWQTEEVIETITKEDGTQVEIKTQNITVNVNKLL